MSKAIPIFHKYLNESLINITNLNTVLKKTGAVIAGSSVLESILTVTEPRHKRWLDTDFDIWVTDDTSKYFDPVQEFHGLLTAARYEYKSGFKCFRSHYARLKKWVKKIHVYHPTMKGSKQRTIQIMVLLPGVTPARVINTFDLDICQVWYDGANIQALPNYKLTHEMHITPEGKNQTTREWIRTFGRIQKYRKRGFACDLWSMVKMALETFPAQKPLVYSFQRSNQESLDRTVKWFRTRISHWVRSIDNIVYEDISVRMLAYDSDENKYVVIDEDNAILLSTLDARHSLKIRMYDMKGHDFEVALPNTARIIAVAEIKPKFVFPADWDPAIRREELQMGLKNTLYNLENCFEFTMVTHENIGRYLEGREDVEDAPTEQEIEDRIVILGPATENHKFGQNAVCFTRELVRAAMQNLTAIALPCVGRNGFPVDHDARFYRISLETFPIYVPESDMQQMASRFETTRVYQASKTNLEIPKTASADTVINRNGISADKCQVGTEKRIYRLKPVYFVAPTTT